MSPATRVSAQQQAAVDRVAAAHSAEMRAVHALGAVVLLVVVGGYTLAVRPWLHLRAATRGLEAAAAAAEREALRLERDHEATREAAEALAAARRVATMGPDRLRREIAHLVEQGRALEPDDPYKAAVRVTAGPAGPAAGGETVPVEEAVRKAIGRHVEQIGLAVETAAAPLLARPDLPAALRALVTETQAAIGPATVALHEAMLQAFARYPDFWRQWEQEPALYAGVSPEAGDAARRIDDALARALRQLAAMSATLQNQTRAYRDRAGDLRERHRQAAHRLAALRAGSAWMPLGLDDGVRLYPLLAGALALTLYYRLRRALAVRRDLADLEPDRFAPSWLLVGPRMPGRWWALALLAVPMAAAVSVAAVLLADRSVFVTPAGEWSPVVTAGYAIPYTVLGLLSIVEWARLATGQRDATARRAAGSVHPPAEQGSPRPATASERR
ncbi:MAG: hypothetical protein QN157_07315 [Armatimonadota bacterium]|nr:hypothetical protein [Armatimonadota bacterium]